MSNELEEIKKEVKNEMNMILPPSLQGYEVDRSEFGIVSVKKENFEYQVSAIVHGKNETRADVALHQDGKRLYKDRFMLNSGLSRKKFASGCAKEEEIKQKIEKHLLDIEEILEKMPMPGKIGKNKKSSELTAEEIKEAEDLLISPKLLYDIKSTFSKLFIAGEEKNCLLIYLSGTSRILDSPISLTGKGESSIGKSYTIEKILKLFPKDSYEDISDATKMSFFHAEQDAFKHKIMVLFEKPGTEQTDYSIRTLQSEKKLKLQITVKDPDTGEFRTEVKEVDGPVAFFTTTTSPNIHPENETRCFSLYGDNSDQQTFNTFGMTDAKYRGLQEIPEEDLVKFKNIQKILKPYPVFIPFLKEIREKFPLRPIRVRRDYGRLLAAIEAVAILHQYQRQKKEISGKEYLVATLADYHIAKIIIEDILRQTIFELSPKSKQLVEIARELLLEKEAKKKPEEFTIRELSRKSGDHYDTTHKWFKPAFEHGYFEVKEENKGSKAAKYILADNKIENMPILPDVREMAKIYTECLGDIYDPITGEKVKM